MKLSVILTTYNPRLDLLEWTLASLRQQTLPPEAWELIIVDNNSSPPLDEGACSRLAGRPLHLVRESKPGQIHARIRGVDVARSALLVFVDDDNRLCENYLEEALRIAQAHAKFGAFGGVAEGVFERQPREWQRALLPYLAVRDHGDAPITSRSLDWGRWEPIGAGLVVRRSALDFFSATVTASGQDRPLGRKPGELLSGDDTLIAKSSIRGGYANSYQPGLRLQHFVQSERLRPSYLRRLLEGYGHSHVKMQLILGQRTGNCRDHKVFSMLKKAFRKRFTREGRAGAIRWYWHVGQVAELCGLGPDEAFFVLGQARASLRQSRRSVLVPADRRHDVASSDRAWQKARELVRQAASLLPVLDPGQRLDGTDVLSSRAFEMLRRAAVLAGTKFPKKTIPWKPANGLRTIGDGRGGLFHICLAPRTDLHLRVRKPQDALLVVQGNPLAEQQRTDFSLNETFIGSHVFSRSRGADALVLPLRLAAGDNLLSFSFHGVQNAARRTVMFLSRLSLFSDDVRQWSVDSPRRRRQYGKLKQEPAAREVAPIAPKTHRISVVIPCRNSGATLERTIRSLLEQNYPDLEIILMDGASIDETGEIIQRYRDRLAVVERGPDGGQVDAINHGFRLATGELRGWLCADDELLPGCLHEVNRLFDSHPESGVVSGGCERVYADRSREITRPPADVWSVIGMRNPLEQPSTFWRTDLHKRVGELDAGYELVFDWDLWARFAEAGARIATTSHPLSRYHFSEDNKTSSAGSLHAQEGLRIIRRYGPLDGSVADAYQILYHFDLLGCLDRRGGRAEPVTGTYRKVRALLASIVGQQSMDLYNLHFASLQERGLVWWR